MDNQEKVTEIMTKHLVFGPVGNCVECLLDDIQIVDQVVEVTLWYPEMEVTSDSGLKNPHTVEVGLIAVRSVPPVRISYNYARDGWVIMVGRWVETTNNKGIVTSEQTFDEVAFIPT